MNVIEAEGLTKRYSGTLAVDAVSLHVSSGDIYGFLGLNGAGKTTTIRMLLGMIKPSKGSVLLFGKEVGTDQHIWRKVGYMVESTHAYPDLSVYENLRLFYRYYGLKDTSDISRIIEQLNLGRYRNTKARHLSMGNLQRLGLAKALMHKPALLILDEPVNGLDPAGMVEVRELLKELSLGGTTVLISSHILSEISKIAHKTGIIHEGRLIKELHAQQLHGELMRKLVIDTVNNREAMRVLQQHELKTAINAQQEIELSAEEAVLHPESITALLVKHGVSPRKVYLFEEDLESYFLRIISEKKP